MQTSNRPFQTDQALETIPYASPFAAPKHLAPAVWLCAIGLGLILLGGCFLVGVLITIKVMTRSYPGTLTTSAIVLEVVLYVAAFFCFAGALFLLVRGVRGLFRLIA